VRGEGLFLASDPLAFLVLTEPPSDGGVSSMFILSPQTG
jgi:hypothetical protein